MNSTWCIIVVSLFHIDVDVDVAVDIDIDIDIDIHIDIDKKHTPRPWSRFCLQWIQRRG
jgi:hypothetical protein